MGLGFGGSSMPGGLMGLNPQQLQGISQALMGFGQGLAGGQGWGQGVAMGLGGANQGLQQAQAYATAAEERKAKQKLLDLETQKYQSDMDRQTAYDNAAAKLPKPIGIDDVTWGNLPAEEKVKLSAGIVSNSLTPKEPYSTSGKLDADLAAGKITQAEHDAALKKENYIAYPQPQQPQLPAADIQLMNKYAVDFETQNGKKPSIQDFQSAGFYGGIPQQHLITAADLLSPTGMSRQPDVQGQPVPAPAQSTSLENKESVDFQKRQVAAAQVQNMAGKIKTQLAQGTGVGVTGWLTQTLAGAGAQAQQLAHQFGADTSILDPKTYGIDTSGAAAGSAALQSDILGLAYQIALAQNGSRVTEQDVRKALAQIGSADVLADPKQMAAALDSVTANMQSNLQIESQMRGMPLLSAPGQQPAQGSNTYEQRYGLAPLP